MKITIANLYPLLTTAQGDEGNARVLAGRAALRDLETDIVTVDAGALPAADIYLVGGLGNGDLNRLAVALGKGRALAERVEDGAVVLAVDGGYQILGEWFTQPDGFRREGLGILDIRTSAGDPVRGPVVTRPNLALGLPAMSGYENHSARTELGTEAAALAQLELGTGNGGTPAADGACAGHVIGTYLHGPVLARNPEMADLLLEWATGLMLPPVRESYAQLVRAQRIAEDLADHTGWAGARR